MPKITTAIGEAGFELVRNRIGEILITELAEQHTLNPISGVTNATVYIERFRSFDNVEVPAVNVTIASDEFGQRTAVSGDGTVTYNIDCYTSAPTTAAVAGDTSAMVRLQRLLGICRAILMDSRYIRLDFAAPFVMSRAVTSMQLAKPQDATDGLSMVMGRLVMTVRVPEEVSQAVLLEIAGYDTQVKLGLTKKGYVFSGDNIPVPPFTGSEVSVNGVLFALVECGEPLNIPLVNSDGNNVGLVNFGDDVVAPDATYTLINTAVPPATLDSGSIPSGGDLPIVAPPATVKLVDTADNQLAQVTVPSGVMTDVTAPDATLKLNNSLTTYPIRSGELYNMLVRLNGQVPQTFSYTPGTKTLDVISPPCADGTVDINGDQVATVASGGLVNIMVEQDGNPVGAFDPNTNSWVIPSCPVAAVSLAVSDTTPNVRDTITLTATANFAATSYRFEAYDGAGQVLFIVEQAGNVYSWTVPVEFIGTFTINVLATDGTLRVWAENGPVIITPILPLQYDSDGYGWSSARRIDPTDTDPLIRVRRTSDSAEADIGATANGNLDESALLAFVGTSEFRYVRIYGKGQAVGHDLVQLTPSLQPFGGAGGSIHRNAQGRPCPRFDGTQFMDVPSSTALFNFLHNGNDFYYYGVFTKTSAGTMLAMFNYNSSADQVGSGFFLQDSGVVGFRVRSGNTGQIPLSNDSAAGRYGIGSTFILSHEGNAGASPASSRSRGRVNGGSVFANNAQTGTPSASNSAANLTIGRAPSVATAFFVGNFAELVIWPKHLANRAFLEDVINDYYTTY